MNRTDVVRPMSLCVFLALDVAATVTNTIDMKVYMIAYNDEGEITDDLVWNKKAVENTGCS
jgi:hypothetical protein